MSTIWRTPKESFGMIPRSSSARNLRPDSPCRTFSRRRFFLESVSKLPVLPKYRRVLPARHGHSHNGGNASAATALVESLLREDPDIPGSAARELLVDLGVTMLWFPNEGDRQGIETLELPDRVRLELRQFETFSRFSTSDP